MAAGPRTHHLKGVFPMSSNLTIAGWLLLTGSLVLLCSTWYLAKFVLGLHFSTPEFIIGGGVALYGGGAWVLDRLGIEITN